MSIQVKLPRSLRDTQWTGLDYPECNEAAPAAALALTKVLNHRIPQLPAALVPEMYQRKSLVTQHNLTQDPTRISASQLFPPEAKPFLHPVMVMFQGGEKKPFVDNSSHQAV